MAVASNRSQHRHYKTLIVLIVAMTGGTLFLYKIGQLAPVTPLRSSTAAVESWRQIGIRIQSPTEVPGFYHWRVDERGNLYRSSAWRQGQQDPLAPGVIQILLTTSAADRRVVEPQTSSLAHLLADLRGRYGIAENQIIASRVP